MNKYSVVITYKVEDTIEVTAVDKHEAMDLAIGEVKKRNKLTSDFGVKEVELAKKSSWLSR